MMIVTLPRRIDAGATAQPCSAPRAGVLSRKAAGGYLLQVFAGGGVELGLLLAQRKHPVPVGSIERVNEIAGEKGLVDDHALRNRERQHVLSRHLLIDREH